MWCPNKGEGEGEEGIEQDAKIMIRQIKGVDGGEKDGGEKG